MRCTGMISSEYLMRVTLHFLSKWEQNKKSRIEAAERIVMGMSMERAYRSSLLPDCFCAVCGTLRSLAQNATARRRTYVQKVVICELLLLQSQGQEQRVVVIVLLRVNNFV
jgi:hypothetical protein